MAEPGASQAAALNAAQQRQAVIKAPLAGDQAGRAMQDGCCCRKPAGKAPFGTGLIARLQIDYQQPPTLKAVAQRAAEHLSAFLGPEMFVLGG